MPEVSNKQGKTANVEACGMVNVDLTANGDYPTRKAGEHFGLILPSAGAVKLTLLDGTEDVFSLPAGYNPVAAVLVHDAGSVLKTFIAYY